MDLPAESLQTLLQIPGGEILFQEILSAVDRYPNKVQSRIVQKKKILLVLLQDHLQDFVQFRRLAQAQFHRDVRVRAQQG